MRGHLTEFLDEYKEDLIYWALTTPEGLREQPRADLLKYSGSNSCYGSLRDNLIYGDSTLHINLNSTGPIRQFLEEKVKLSLHMKPLQKLVGYKFLEAMKYIYLNFFNKVLPYQGIKDIKTDQFRIKYLDFLYSNEFFTADMNENFKIKEGSDGSAQGILSEMYMGYSINENNSFPDNFISLIETDMVLKKEYIFKNDKHSVQIKKFREEFEENLDTNPVYFMYGLI